MDDSAYMQKLEAWLGGHKSRTVQIEHDDGYGASPGWQVRLRGRGITVEVSEALIDDGWDWAGLPKVILKALQLAEEKGL